MRLFSFLLCMLLLSQHLHGVAGGDPDQDATDHGRAWIDYVVRSQPSSEELENALARHWEDFRQRVLERTGTSRMHRLDSYPQIDSSSGQSAGGSNQWMDDDLMRLVHSRASQEPIFTFSQHRTNSDLAQSHTSDVTTDAISDSQIGERYNFWPNDPAAVLTGSDGLKRPFPSEYEGTDTLTIKVPRWTARVPITHAPSGSSGASLHDLQLQRLTPREPSTGSTRSNSINQVYNTQTGMDATKGWSPKERLASMSRARQLWNRWMMLGSPSSAFPTFMMDEEHKLDAVQTALQMQKFTQTRDNLRHHMLKYDELILSKPLMFSDWLLHAAHRHIIGRMNRYHTFNAWGQSHVDFLRHINILRDNSDVTTQVVYQISDKFKLATANSLLTWYTTDFHKFLDLVSNEQVLAPPKF